MKKRKIYRKFGKRNSSFLLSLSLACLIIFAPFGDTFEMLDIETETLENVIDIENEVKDQEKLENLVFEDLIAQNVVAFEWLTTNTCVISNFDLDRLRVPYFKIPTPPPDVA